MRPSTSHIVCPHCAGVNRVPSDKPARQARCGACHRDLFEGHPCAVDAAAFEKHRHGNDIVVLVDVWAPWCGPCRVMGPMFERAASELEPNVRLLKVNADEEPRIASELGAQAATYYAALARCALVHPTMRRVSMAPVARAMI